MNRTLITGMSGTGKSSTICALETLGHRAVDLDSDRWCQFVPDDSGFADPAADRPLDWRWREDEVRALLTGTREPLFVAGTSTYQGRLYPLLRHVVLLTVPTETATARLASRTTNSYGRDPDELRRELRLRTVVEPELRSSACLVVDTSARSVADVAALIVDHALRGTHTAPEGRAATLARDADSVRQNPRVGSRRPASPGERRPGEPTDS